MRVRGVLVAVVVLAVAAGPLPVGAIVAADASGATAPYRPHYVRDGKVSIPSPTPVVQPDGRMAHETAYVPFATFGTITLSHPAAVVERIGLHQSNHEGARDMVMTETAAAPAVLESRGRESGRQSAADVVVPPDVEIRSPVTGTVLRAGTYVLYCEHADDFMVVAPDTDPSFDVKVLHIDGVTVAAGDRVVAGETVIAPRATVLPFGSQVDATTARPAWPHTHIEVIDTAIPDVPNGGSGSGC